MHRGNQIEFARQLEIMDGDIEGRIMRAKDRETECDAIIAV